ncbi:Glyoxylase, beta-lactamase superfamily II [Fodinibius salinus]|uniref:Glyoxylase, beta-lactamase superfamily II n=1 Tax=Fodinibius salinus TaxID=860790 RepID=A0A5D3YPV5_9BACT|nr:MBL fold metallo-hydrolase [Fodinibius salinus]TYP95278.1 Glyoxylase, beta-lactamase superfamily II [Fodinibius salinus]
MQIHSFTVGPFAENTYLLIQGEEALIVDPGFAHQQEYQAVKTKIKSSGATLSAIVLTHAHVDHVLGIDKVLSDNEIPVFLSDEDHWLWNNFSSQASMFGLQAEPFDFEPQKLPITSKWEIGNFCFDIRYTPGHAPDHVSLYGSEDEILIAGDTIFKEGIGRTDLYKGDLNMLKQSIQNQLYVLPDDTTVYPGHGPATTIGHEKQSNPFVQS